MKTITFLNEKGGVGKTTLAMTLAAGMAIQGQRVLLIDGDSQGHISVSLQLKPKDGLFRLMAQEAKWSDILISPDPSTWLGSYPQDKAGSLWILPGNATTVAIPTVVSDGGLLRERLEELDGHVDVVIIDTAPQLGMMHTIFYLATNSLIHPVQCERFALNALGRSAAHSQRMNADRAVYGLGAVNVIGVVPNMYSANTAAHRQGLDFIKEKMGEDQVLSPIGMRTAWREASYVGRSIFANNQGSEAEHEAWTMVGEVGSRMGV
jgi:chromosome partitioning protein